MSNPYPDTWLEECIDSYRNTDLESVKSSEWMNLLWKNITEDLCQAKELITQARSFCNAPGGPYLYDEALQSDLILIRAAEEKAAAGDFDGAGELLGKPAFAALSRKKPKDPVDDTLKEQVKSLRENAKGYFKGYWNTVFFRKGGGTSSASGNLPGACRNAGGAYQGIYPYVWREEAGKKYSGLYGHGAFCAGNSDSKGSCSGRKWRKRR